MTDPTEPAEPNVYEAWNLAATCASKAAIKVEAAERGRSNMLSMDQAIAAAQAWAQVGQVWATLAGAALAGLPPSSPARLDWQRRVVPPRREAAR